MVVSQDRVSSTGKKKSTPQGSVETEKRKEYGRNKNTDRKNGGGAHEKRKMIDLILGR